MVSGQLKALLGVLAVAGYQNRDKIAEVLRGIQRPQPGGSDPSSGTTSQPTSGLDDLLGKLTGSGGSTSEGGLGGLLGGLTSGGILSGGLGDLLKTFQENGQGGKAESWISPGTNEDIDDSQLEQAIGSDTLEELASKTGLSKEEILSRLSKDLPRAVDELTPDGQVPNQNGQFSA